MTAGVVVVGSFCEGDGSVVKVVGNTGGFVVPSSPPLPIPRNNEGEEENGIVRRVVVSAAFVRAFVVWDADTIIILLLLSSANRMGTRSIATTDEGDGDDDGDDLMFPPFVCLLF